MTKRVINNLINECPLAGGGLCKDNCAKNHANNGQSYMNCQLYNDIMSNENEYKEITTKSLSHELMKNYDITEEIINYIQK